jgi:hypothetical protein
MLTGRLPIRVLWPDVYSVALAILMLYVYYHFFPGWFFLRHSPSGLFSKKIIGQSTVIAYLNCTLFLIVPVQLPLNVSSVLLLPCSSILNVYFSYLPPTLSHPPLHFGSPSIHVTPSPSICPFYIFQNSQSFLQLP